MDNQAAVPDHILKNVLDTAPFPMGLYTGYQMKIVMANRSMIQTWGKGNDVIGKNYTNILPELENQKIFDQLRRVLATGEPFEARNARMDIVVDGILMHRYFNYNFTPIYDQAGKIYGVMNTAAEVTELNISRQQNIAAQQQLHHAIDAAEIGTFEKDLDNRTITGSQRFYEIWGIDPGASTEQEMVARLHPDDIAVRDLAYERFHATGHLDYDVNIQVKGRQKFVRIKGSLSLRDNGRYIIGVVQDITEQKLFALRLKDMVEQQTMQLKRSNEDLSQLGHVMSHDLKEPVRKIAVFSNILREAINAGEKTKTNRYIDKISNSAARVTTMIDDILLYSSMEGNVDLFDQVDLNAIILRVQENFELTIQEKGATFVLEELPPYKGSASLLQQLFHNLIGNSLKFTSPGVPPVITITGRTSGNMLYIEISDNGIGIEDKYLDKVFGTFQRLHAKDKFEGTGLGLALCRKIVERHKGTIRAISNGTGAKFLIELAL
ncbi:MAG: PAS domain-containing sensor histidine kinase [Flavobacterium psychrophilum]|nr:MAG: PAS domain-containing sensor histidine kinase [Flavobacterium psychrophilum]